MASDVMYQIPFHIKHVEVGQLEEGTFRYGGDVVRTQEQAVEDMLAAHVRPFKSMRIVQLVALQIQPLKIAQRTKDSYRELADLVLAQVEGG